MKTTRNSAQLTLGIRDELIVDNFAGGGGASLGIEQALGRSVDIAINHDREAIAMHTANHPHTAHYCEDVFDIDPEAVTGGQPVGLAWFSPDCKHFSKAKGKKPVSKKIRGLAWVVVKWARTVKPRVIMLENVEEFQTWGPLVKDANGNQFPCPLRKGLTFRRWWKQLENAGYKLEMRELRGCDYGAPTIRKRLFIIGRRDSLPIRWPQPTHGNGKGLIPYRTAAECIDWSIPCPSIFERVRPLAEATQRRIAKGIKKFVIDSSNPFIVTCNHAGGGFRGQGIDEPFKTVTSSRDAHGLTLPSIVPYYGGERDRAHAVNESLRTQTADPKFSLVTSYLVPRPVEQIRLACNCGHTSTIQTLATPCEACGSIQSGHVTYLAPYFVPRYGERPTQEPRTHAANAPLPTITPDANCGRLVAPFLTKFRKDNAGAAADKPVPTITANSFIKRPGGCVPIGIVSPMLVGAGGPVYSGKPTTINRPANTVTAENHSALVLAFLAQHNAGFYEGGGRPLFKPLSTILQSGSHQSVVTSHLMKFRGTCQHGQDNREPMHTITSQGLHIAEVRAFLIKFYGEGGQLADPRDPMHTIPTKDRIGVVTLKGEDYIIADIGMRMLKPRELYLAQGFDESYKIDIDIGGKRLSQAAQVRMVGNSVCPPIARALVEANFAHERLLSADGAA